MATIVQSIKSMPGTSGAPSARTLLKSLGLHAVTLASVMLVPAGALRHSASPKELDVVFYRPTPRIEVPMPVLHAAPGGELSPARPGPTRVAQAAAPAASRDPEPSAPGGPLPEETPGYPEPAEEPPVAEAPPPQKAANPGLLAFKEKFASLAQDKEAPRLGAEARFSDVGDTAPASTRPALTANGPGGSGGINLASLSRIVGGTGGHGAGGTGGGGGGQGVAVGRVTSGIAPLGGGSGRGGGGGNGSGGGGGGGGGGGTGGGGGGLTASRTDEEIQIVFDRYKASFYRLYNRELRNDPTLSGQMVLRLTIEPDGSVSMCALQSTDMKAPDLVAQVLNRVRSINFGAKEGVQAVTIVYPIDFLPSEAGN